MRTMRHLRSRPQINRAAVRMLAITPAQLFRPFDFPAYPWRSPAGGYGHETSLPWGKPGLGCWRALAWFARHSRPI